MKIISWNVNGIRAIAKKGFEESRSSLNADVLCLQETKAQVSQVEETLALPDNLPLYANHAERKGYSGTATISQTEPLKVTYDMGIAEHDNEGRIVTAEYDKFYLVNVYVPNSGRELVRLDYRSQWDQDFLKYLQQLDQKKPVIACGDFNVAHQAMDLKNPKSNYNKTAGYTQVEIDGFTNFLSGGFIDTFRHQHPEEVAYSYWSFRMNARANNVGWRIDYFLISERIEKNLSNSFILPQYMGSDHCPVGIELNL
ncbi:exodeoxyribonuclease III [Fulvivirgaceae bacterium BMA12]|uniref:Exodeoxyribonuclease III n=1 Tax=Agaribacillus aureus TaxID=3051825 RepID=A0ABT8LHE5_9BACT|nr:exodeoxyribonuclease III [Fulvivirgaceae bacterium BMA12]